MVVEPSDQMLGRIAQRFRLLGDPLRLRLLHLMAKGERAVGDLVAETGAGQANVSKHLALLLREGLVSRRKQGLQVFYAVQDPRVFELCDVVCGGLNEHLARELQAIEEARGGARGATRSTARRGARPAARRGK